MKLTCQRRDLNTLNPQVNQSVAPSYFHLGWPVPAPASRSPAVLLQSCFKNSLWSQTQTKVVFRSFRWGSHPNTGGYATVRQHARSGWG
jgi:hypothetical protein